MAFSFVVGGIAKLLARPMRFLLQILQLAITIMKNAPRYLRS